MGDDDPRCGTIFDPRGMVGKIYKEDHYTLIHTKYEGLVVSEKIFFMFFFPMTHPGRGPYMDPRGMICRIYKEGHYTLLHTKYESSGSCMFFPLLVNGSYLLPWKPEF